MCPFMSDVYFVNVDCNFSHWTTFNSLRQLGQNETSLQPFKFVYLCEPFCLSLSVVQGGIRVNLTPKSRQGFYITRQDEHAPVSMTFPGEGGSENHENFDIFQVFPEWHEKSDIFRGSLKKFLKAKKSDF